MSSFMNTEAIAEAKPQNLTNVMEAAKLFKAGMTGTAGQRAKLQEAFTTSDFPGFLGKALDIELLNLYRDIEPEWKDVADPYTVNDFRPKKLVDLFGIRDFDDVGQGEEYKAKPIDETIYEIKGEKTGATYGLTWELNLSQDWDALSNLPGRMANASRRTEDKKVFGALIDPAGGPSKALFTGEYAPSNLPLTAENLEAAYSAMVTRDGYNGNPVDLTKAVLVVHPALRMTAERIVNAEFIETTSGKTTSREPNPFRGMFKVVAPRALQSYDKGPNAATTWYILPGVGSENPALAKVGLVGHENPDIRYQNNQGNAVGGGQIDHTEGSFNDDTIWYRGRHVIGGATLMPYGAYASTGQGA